MPIYEYRCEQGHTFEVMQRMSDDPLASCETCAAPVRRVFHPVAVHFKGSGFYNTDYGTRKRSREKNEGGEGGSKGGEGGSKGGEGGSKGGEGGSSKGEGGPSKSSDSNSKSDSGSSSNSDSKSKTKTASASSD